MPTARKLSHICQVYLTDAASTQKKDCLELFGRLFGADAATQCELLYEGIESLIARDPFSLPSTTKIKSNPDCFLLKTMFGPQPLSVVILFTDDYCGDGRWLQKILIRDSEGNVLI